MNSKYVLLVVNAVVNNINRIPPMGKKIGIGAGVAIFIASIYFGVPEWIDAIPDLLGFEAAEES